MKMNKLAVARFSHGGRARMWADAKSQSSLLSLCTYTQSNNSSIMWPLGICHTCWVFFPSPNLKPNYHIAADCFPVNMKYKNKTTHLLKGNAQTVLQKCWQVEKNGCKEHTLPRETQMQEIKVANRHTSPKSQKIRNTQTVWRKQIQNAHARPHAQPLSLLKGK